MRALRGELRAELTARECEVLEVLLESGLSNKEIAARLRIADNTVRCHLRSVYRKLGCTTRVEVAVKMLAPKTLEKMK
jgi:DNA-binding NarL/FixJ family response regulator